MVSNGTFQELSPEQQVRGDERFNIDQVVVVAPGGGQVKDQLRRGSSEDFVQFLAAAVMGVYLRLSREVEQFVLLRRGSDDQVNVMACGQEVLGHMVSDEPRCAGNQDSHFLK